jgi:hypothetical protein
VEFVVGTVSLGLSPRFVVFLSFILPLLHINIDVPLTHSRQDTNTATKSTTEAKYLTAGNSRYVVFTPPVSNSVLLLC